MRLVATYCLIVLALGSGLGAGWLDDRAGVRDAAPDDPIAQARLIMSAPLPQMNGGRLRVSMVEVTYGAGAGSSPHSHPCPVIGYVMDGAIRSQVRGQGDSVYQSGQTFYESPAGVHRVSANARTSKASKLLAVFICDQEQPLSGPVVGGQISGRVHD